MRGYQFWLSVGLLLLISGCASTYVTPGGPAKLDQIDGADIATVAARQPAASFPAQLAVVRVQAADYRSESVQPDITGRYSVITTGELLTDTAQANMGSWPAVAGAAPVGRLLLPTQVNTLDDLRLAAARLQADVLLVYTIDTGFRIRDKSYASLAILSLGLVPDRDAHISSTASALFIDVRSGYVYGQAEGTARASGLTNIWHSSATVDRKRIEAERSAFVDMMASAKKTWTGIVAHYAH